MVRVIKNEKDTIWLLIVVAVLWDKNVIQESSRYIIWEEKLYWEHCTQQVLQTERWGVPLMKEERYQNVGYGSVYSVFVLSCV
jgi:hypothetical protein